MRVLTLLSPVVALRFKITNKWHTPELTQTFEALRDIQTLSGNELVYPWVQEVSNSHNYLKTSRCAAFGCADNPRPLLRAFDIRTANGFYIPRVEYSSSVSQMERRLLIFSPCGDGWYSEYEFDHGKIKGVEFGCVDERGSKTKGGDKNLSFDLSTVQDELKKLLEDSLSTFSFSYDGPLFRYHACLETQADVTKLNQVVITHRPTRQVIFVHDCLEGDSDLQDRNTMGGWAMGLILKNPEYRTINEAQSAGDSEEKSGLKTSASQGDLEDDDSVVDTGKRVLTRASLAEIAKDKKVLSNLGMDNLLYISQQLKSLKENQSTTCEGSDRLKCLSSLIENFPTHLPHMLAHTDSEETSRKMKRAINFLHSKVDPRWNALAVNGKMIGSQFSGSSASRLMSQSLIHDTLSNIVIPVYSTYERFENAGLHPHVVTKILNGFKLNEDDLDWRRRTNQDDSPILRLLHKFNSTEPKLPAYSGNRFRWDYRSLPRGAGGYLLIKASDISTKSISPSQAVNNLSQLLMGAAGPSPPYSFRVSLIHIIFDPSSQAHLLALKEFLSSPPSSTDVRLMPMGHHELGRTLSSIILTQVEPDQRDKHRSILKEFIMDLISQIEDGSSLTKDLIDDICEEHFGKGVGKADPGADLVKNSLTQAGFQSGHFYVSVTGRVMEFKLPQRSVSSEVFDAVGQIVAQEKQNLLLLLLATLNPMSFGTSSEFFDAYGHVDEALISRASLLTFLQGVDEKSQLPSTQDERDDPTAPMSVPYTGWKDRATRDGLKLLIENRNLTDQLSLSYRSILPNIDDMFLASGVPSVSARNGLCSFDTLNYDEVSGQFAPRHSTKNERLSVSSLNRVWLSPTILAATTSVSPAPSTATAIHTVVLFVDNSVDVGELNMTLTDEFLMPVEFRVSRTERNRVCFNQCSKLGPLLPAQIHQSSQAVLWIDGLVVDLDEADLTIRSEMRSTLHSLDGFVRSGILKCALSETEDRRLRSLCLDNYLVATSASIPDWIGRTQWMYAHVSSILDEQSDGEFQSFSSIFNKASIRPLRLTAQKIEDAPLVIKAIIDPLSKYAQHTLPNLAYLHQWLNATIQILLNPAQKYNDLPLNRWSRNVILPPLTAEYEDGWADFSSIKTDEILSASLESPNDWFVENTEDNVDLDNIYKNTGADVTYELQGIYVEGIVTAYQISEKSEFNSTQGILRETEVSPDLAGGHTLILSKNDQDKHTHIDDAISMKRPGYFQFKVPRPGIYNLGMQKSLTHIQVDEVRAQPRRKLDYWFEVKPVLKDSGMWIEQKQRQIHVYDLSNKALDLSLVSYMTDRSMIELPPLLSNAFESSSESLWSQLWGGRKPQRESKIDQVDLSKESVNVFSLASGHMYERLLRIMMLSVISNTDRFVTFWILDNFLSAKFKHKVLKMEAKFHGKFKVNYVSYKWPQFLRPQVEKQRQIWACKILFLDTLFPANLKRIIYIDADQIVRADIGELWDLDLQDRVYGFTPMCSDRDETAPFRFWDSGYWADYLEKEYKYHISALFVVDLALFRTQQIGTDLRQLYNQLSADPGSLANLDQDLPNFAQKDVPIFSLPQEWLWCETWCSDKTKPKAKTIDLCNNPLTHEPKLKQATRIVHEWADYDQQLQDLIQDSFDKLPLQIKDKDEL